MAQLEGEVQLRAQPCARALDGGAAGLARREEGLVGGREEGLVAAGRRPAPLEGLGEGLGLGLGGVWVRAWVRVWVWAPAS